MLPSVDEAEIEMADQAAPPPQSSVPAEAEAAPASTPAEEGRGLSQTPPAVEEGTRLSQTPPGVEEGTRVSQTPPGVEEGAGLSPSPPAVEEGTRLSQTPPAVEEGSKPSSMPPAIEEADEMAAPSPSRAEVAVAKRHAHATALTEYDGEKDEYKFRSIWGTRRVELGQYGVGIQLYFELLYYLGVCFGVMTLVTLPLLGFSYLGDFAGSAAGLFVRLTAGNLGRCGEFGELCPNTSAILDRKLFDSSGWSNQWVAENMNWQLKDVSIGFGILDGLAALVMFVLVAYFDRNIVGKIVQTQDEANITPADFSIQVLLLPRKLESPEMHMDYRELLKTHFERLLGEKTDGVAEVVLVRDYDQSVAVFMEIGELQKEVEEYKARIQDSKPEETKRRQKMEKYVSKLEKQIAKNKSRLRRQRDILDTEREVVTAFVIFNDEKYKELILYKYRWANYGSLFRYFQSTKIRFLATLPIAVREAPEPSDLYQENLDMSKKQKRIRRSMTCCFSFGLLLLCTGLMIWAQSSLLKVQIAPETSTVWVVSQEGSFSASPSSACMVGCELQLYGDSSCEVASLLQDVTVFDSTLQLDPARRLVNGAVGGEKSEDMNMCTGTGVWYPAGQAANTFYSCLVQPEAVLAASSVPVPGRCNLSKIMSGAVLGPGVGCTADYWDDPCCYSNTQLSSTDRAAADVGLCDAHEFDYRVAKQRMTLAEYLDDICQVKLNYDAANYLPCNSVDVQRLQAASPSCGNLLQVSGSRLFCECKSDLDILVTVPGNDFSGLQTCHVFDSELGANPLVADWKYSKALFTDRLDRACEENHRSASDTSTVGSEIRIFIQTDASAATVVTGDQSLLDMDNVLEIVAVSTDTSFFNAPVWTRISVKVESGASTTDIENALSSAVQSAFDPNVQKSDIVVVQDTETCGNDYFQCGGSEECVHVSRKCDGFPDCAWEDKEGVAWDEANCPTSGSAGNAEGCLPNQFVCQTSGACIEDVFWCDGVDDCGDNSDETNEECLLRQEQIEAASLPRVSQWAGFRFGATLAPACAKYAVPRSLAANNKLVLFNCDETAVFRNNKVTLRDPYLLCRQVATLAFDLESSSPKTYSQSAGDANKYAHAVSEGANCGSDADCSSGEVCYAKDEHIGSGTGSGRCRRSIASISNYSPIRYEPDSCPLSRPVSIVAARAVHQRVEAQKELLLKDPTYTCYCKQQVQYRLASDPLYLFGPYDQTEDKKICEAYLRQQIVLQSMVVASIVAVSLLNFLLRSAMMFMAQFEKHDSLSAKVYSEMRKLFLVLFVNTAIIILLVNAKFQNISEYTVVGFGKGSYSDFTRDWFTVVGAGFAVTIIVQTVSIIIAPVLTGYLYYWLQRRSARKFKTQDKMNSYYEYPEFALSLRLAQTLMIVFACLLYSGGVPILNLLAFLYFVLAYWTDKFVLLRLSKIPPQFDADMVSTSSKLIVGAVLLHCLFTIYMFTNQIVMPSDFVDQSAEDRFLQNVDINRYYDYLFSDIPAEAEAYTFYLKARLLDSFRKAAVGNVGVALVVLAYLSFGNVMRVFFATIRFMGRCFNCKKVSEPIYSGTTQQTYSDSVNEMIRNRIVHTYHGNKNPRYAAAFRAIANLDHETSTMRAQSPQH